MISSRMLPSFRLGMRYGVRFQSTSTGIPAEPNKREVGVPNPQDLTQQAPNRIETWSPSQRERQEAMTGPRFQGKDMTRQPRPYAAIDLIAKAPIRYLEHTNVAVCDGNGGMQGHPKIFINLDPPKPATCGYCGLRFARAELKSKFGEV